jgi:hypothetical protein
MPACLIVGLPVIVTDVATVALEIFKISVQLIEMIVIDSAQYVHAVGHVKMVIDMITNIGIVNSCNTEIYLVQNIGAIPGAVGKAKKTIVLF